jgi:WD40 repeat protein
MQAGEIILTLKGERDYVRSVAFSPDGQWIVSGGGDIMGGDYDGDGRRVVRVWNAQTGETLHTLDGNIGNVSSVAFSPDGHWIVSGGYDGAVRVWGTFLKTEADSVVLSDPIQHVLTQSGYVDQVFLSESAHEHSKVCCVIF